MAGQFSFRYAAFLPLFVPSWLVRSATVVNVNIGYFNDPDAHTWAYAADALTWTDNATDTTYRYRSWRQTSGGKVIKKLQSGELDIAELGSFPWANGNLRQVPIKMLSITAVKDEAECLVSRQGIINPQDLRGGRVAYIGGSTTQSMFVNLMKATGLVESDFEWLGHMSAADQAVAWDKGEIDAGFLWGDGLIHLQNSGWCTTPDANGRQCDSRWVNRPGKILFTSSASKMWGSEVFHNLVVSESFAAAHPKTVYRTTKALALLDDKFSTDPGFFTNSDENTCTLLTAAYQPCTAEKRQFWNIALFWDIQLSLAQQVSSEYVGEKVSGECANEAIAEYPLNDGPCNRETMSGSALTSWLSGEFSYQVKNVGFLPSMRYFQSRLSPEFIVAAVDPSLDQFPSLTADSLVDDYSRKPAVTNPAHSFCGDLTQPIVLTTPSTFRDHEGGGHFRDGESCHWQINQGGPVLLSSINVKVERDADKIYIYEGLCTGPSDCSALPLLALFTGGKGMDELTLHNINPRPPVLVPNGKATVSFQPDDSSDVPLNAVVDDGFSMEWSLVTGGGCALPCQNSGLCEAGVCKCTGGWGGADCSFRSCLGTTRLVASTVSATIVDGVPGDRTALNADCRWEITAADTSHVVVIEIRSVDLEWVFDPLRIYDGQLGTAGAQLLEETSGYFADSMNESVGSRCPGPDCLGFVVSSTSTVTVQWTSDSIGTGLGFEIGYYTAPASGVICGPSPVQNCNGQGSCTPQGCLCNSGYFGRFCQLRECSGEALLPTAEAGQIRNAAPGQGSYTGNRDCRWVVRVPARNGQQAGAVAVHLEQFNLEVFQGSADVLKIGAETLRGSSSTCLTSASNRSACQPVVVAGTEVVIQFTTDINNYPAGSSFTGFQLAYEAVYDCPRGANGHCQPLSQCAALGMVPGNLACERCPTGLYFDAPTMSCRACGPGLVPSADQSACEFCAAGSVSKDAASGSCTDCEPGTYTSQQGMTQCAPCEAGTFTASIGSTACEPATAGHYVKDEGAVAELECRPGTVAAERGLSECARCALGTSQNQNGQSACVRCAKGKFAGEGAAECSECTPPMTTEETGSSSPSLCACQEGTYRDEAPNSTTCHPCPAAMFCPFGADQQAFNDECSRPLNPGEACRAPVTIAGYMSTNDDPLSVWLCQSKDHCPGGPPGTCHSELIGLACHHCRPGFSWDGKNCNECAEAQTTAWFYPAFPIMLLPLLVVVSYKMFGDRIEKWGTWQNGTASLAFILLNHFQIVSSFTSTNVDVPQAVASGVGAMAVTSDFSSIFNPECTVFNRFTDSVPLKACGPLIVFVVFLVVWAASQLIAKQTGLRHLAMEINRTANVFFSIIFAFFQAIVQMAFAIFMCGPNPNGKSSVIADRSVVCGSSEWNGMLAIGIVAVVLWCLGFAALFTRAIIFAPEWFDDPGVQMRWKFLFIKYRPDVHWWALAIIAKGILLQVGQLFLDNGHDQLLYLMSVILVYVFLMGIYRPWRHVMVNLADAWAHLCMLMCAACMLSFETEQLGSAQAQNAQDRMSVATLAWCFMVVPMCAVVFALIFGMQNSTAGKKYVENARDQISDAFDLLRSAGTQEIRAFLNHVGEGDLWLYKCTSHSIMTDFGGRKSKSRVASVSAEVRQKWSVSTDALGSEASDTTFKHVETV